MPIVRIKYARDAVNGNIQHMAEMGKRKRGKKLRMCSREGALEEQSTIVRVTSIEKECCTFTMIERSFSGLKHSV
ncbi:hypothetical protein AN958_09916 [Leucoagaricus sp. SymC.cos]|nr:hypothetical protein AN958_09916 [Leucoagaricus sp. SymC.cos]